MKKGLCAVLIAAMLLGLAACGGSGSAPAEKAEEPKKEESASSGKVTELTFWGHQEEAWNISYQKIADEFMAENHYDFVNVHDYKSSVSIEKIFKELNRREYLKNEFDRLTIEILKDDDYSYVSEPDNQYNARNEQPLISKKMSKNCFTVERKDILGRTTDLWQIPLCPAYAITIHKSQGQTFRYINIDGTRCWAPGQLYVAVSRATCIEGIHFLTPIKDENIKTDSAVIEFYKGLGLNP